MLYSTTLDLRAHVRHEAESLEGAIVLAERALGFEVQSVTYRATSGRGAGVVISRQKGRVQCVYTVICQRLQAEDPQRLVVQNRRLSENLRLHGADGLEAVAGVFFIFIPASGTTVYLVVLHPMVIERMLMQTETGLGKPWLRRTSRLELEVPEEHSWPEAVAAAGGKVIAYRRQEW